MRVVLDTNVLVSGIIVPEQPEVYVLTGQKNVETGRSWQAPVNLEV